MFNVYRNLQINFFKLILMWTNYLLLIYVCIDFGELLIYYYVLTMCLTDCKFDVNVIFDFEILLREIV